MNRDRITRPEPARTEPLRSWSALFAGPVGAARGGAGGSLGEVVSRSVDLGYRVVDEYVRQGQKAARRVSERTWEPDAMARDAQDLMARMMQYGSDFMAVWVELMELTTGGVPWMQGAVPGWPARRATNGHDPEPGPEAPPAADVPASGRAQVAVEVASKQPAEVTVDVAADVDADALVVHALREADAKKPRLRDVGLRRRTPGGSLVLTLRVPDRQPAGMYNGMIVDTTTSRPVGTVSVRLDRPARRRRR